MPTFVRGDCWYFVPDPPPKKLVHAVDRTRYPAARSGSRRNGRLARAARRASRPTPMQSPLKGFTPLGWTVDA